MKILNLGSLNIDYVYRLKDIVRPGETSAVLSRDVFCGGKGLNQSVALGRSGADVYHAGLVGEDHKDLFAMLANSGVNTDYIQITNTQTGHAIIQVDDQGQNSIIVFGGANKQVSESFIEDLTSHFSEGDMLVLQNEIAHVDKAIEIASRTGMLVALNPSPFTDEILSYPLDKIDWLILNMTEGEAMSGQVEPHKIIRSLADSYPKMKIVLTMGSGGAMCFDGNSIYEEAGFKVKALDTTGAGDTFTGYFLSYISNHPEFRESESKGFSHSQDFAAPRSLAKEAPGSPIIISSNDKPLIARALRYANAAAALAVMAEGAAQSIPSLQKVEEFLKEQDI